jgi:hypothetical protein
MAAGLSTALDRIEAIIQGCDPDTKWTRSEQRLSTFGDENARAGGINRKYWIKVGRRTGRGIIAGSHHHRDVPVQIQLAQFYGGGDRNSKAFHGLQKQMEARAEIVQESLTEQPANWQRSTTGIINLVLENGGIMDSFSEQTIIWSIDLVVTIRQPDVAATVS